MNEFKKGQILNYSYTGVVQSVILPAGEYKLECWGAQGGSYNTIYIGGKGGYSVGTIIISENTEFYIYIGGQGSKISSSNNQSGGGFNGGGNATTTSTAYLSCGGGGASDIRIGTDSLYTRVIVAGGGGGAFGSTTGHGNGGVGGGTTGGDGVSNSSSYTSGKGATATAVGDSYYGSAKNPTARSDLGGFGYGASAKTSSSYSSGGGGGWYGGGSARRAGAGGGSGFVWIGKNAPSGYLLNSSYYLTDAQTIAGNASFPSPSNGTETGHSENGFARITVLSLKSSYTIYPKVDGVWKTGIGVWIRENDVWKSASVLSIKYGDIWHSSGQGGAITPEPSGQTLGNRAVGSVVKMNVNNTPRDFLIVHQGLPSRFYDDSCDGTWLLMKDIYEKHVWYSENVNKYENSAIHSYLNNTFLNLFNSNAKNIIKQVKIPYRSGGGSSGTDKIGANGLSTKIFLLSGYEVGFTTSDNQYFPVEGAKLSYFESGDSTSANNKRIAKLNGSADYWWLRSPYTHDVNNVWRIFSDGDYNYGGASYSYGLRPALILPSTTVVGEDNLIS